MKKLSYFFIIILAFLTTSVVVDEFNESYYFKLSGVPILVAEQLDKKVLQSHISTTSEKLSISNLIDKMSEFSDENNIPLVVVKPEVKANSNIQNFYVHAPTYDIKKDIYLEKGNIVDLTNKSEMGYYTTDITDRNSSDTIHLLSEKYRDGNNSAIINIKPFYQAQNNAEGWEDIYTFFLISEEVDKDKILKEFKGVNPELLTEGNIGGFERKAISTSLKLIILTISVLLILLTCNINKNMKNISVRKMHGNSISQIITVLFGRFFLVGIIMFMISMVSSFALLVGEISPMSLNIIKQLLSLLGAYIIFYILLTVLIYGFIKILSTALNMKKRHVNYILVNINIILKLVLMIVVIYPFIVTIQDGMRAANELYDIRKYHNREKFRYTIEGVRYSEGDITTGDSFDKNYEQQVYDILNEEGGIYIDTTEISNDFYNVFTPIYLKDPSNADKIDMNKISKQVFTKTYVPFIVVNKEYLRDYEITLNDGSILDLDSIKVNTTLVPKSRRYVKLAKYLSYSDGKATEVISVKNGMNYYNPEIDSEYPERTFKDPIILVVVESMKNMVVNYKSNYFSDIELIQAKLDAAGLKDRYSTRNTDISLQNKIDYERQLLIKGIILVILYTFIVLVFLYQSVYLYMEETKRIISVQYVLGIGRVSRYSEIIVMNLAPHAFLFMISVIFLSIPINLIFNFCAIFMGIELLFMIYMIKKFERSTVIVVLKGE